MNLDALRAAVVVAGFPGCMEGDETNRDGGQIHSCSLADQNEVLSVATYASRSGIDNAVKDVVDGCTGHFEDAVWFVTNGSTWLVLTSSRRAAEELAIALAPFGGLLAGGTCST